MAKDIIFGNTRRNWSRGSRTTALVEVVPTPTTDEVSLRLTELEMAMLADLAATSMRADHGDRIAKAKLAKVARSIVGLRKLAKRGDPVAKRSLLVLQESGVFRGTQTFSMGADSQIPNTSYRAAVLHQAVKLANGKKPTTRDFFKAKSKVDKVMDNAGLTLYLPGSRPGRVMAGWN